MKQAGQICLFRFPRTDLETGKSRPALLITRLPGPFDDWLVCMISSQINQAIEAFDEILDQDETDFVQTGLKTDSVIRIARLAVVTDGILLGAIGEISAERLKRIKGKIAKWIQSEAQDSS
jgi:mRNA interferase MazF